jgi:hypothetical protein
MSQNGAIISSNGPFVATTCRPLGLSFSKLLVANMVLSISLDLPMTACAVEAAVRVNLGVVWNGANNDDRSKCHALLALMELAKKHRPRNKVKADGLQKLSATSLFEQLDGFRALVDVLDAASCNPRLASAIMEALGLFLLFDDLNDTNKKAFRSAGGIDVVLSIMQRRDHSDSAFLVSQHAVVVMQVLTKDNEIMDELITKNAISAVVSAMQSLPHDVKTQYKGSLFLEAVASHHVSVESFADGQMHPGALQVVVTALLNHRNDDRVRPSAIRAIVDLTKNISDGSQEHDVASDGLDVIVSILKQSPTKFHHTNACRIVENLAKNGCMDTVIQSGCIPLLLLGLSQRRNDETTLDAATRTLLVLVSKSEDAKEVIVDADGIHLLSSISRSGSTKDSIRTMASEIHDLCMVKKTAMSENFMIARKNVATDALRQRSPLASVEQCSSKDFSDVNSI